MAKQIIAISHEIEDESTGATATLNGYVSKKAYEAGRNPLCAHSITVNALPEEGEVSRAWLYGKAVE